ncbi:MAG: ATP-binding cassette domain-containing protein, partial [Gammaproteobacteria bacterium]|nr:ATP-binding cassette domain-containing protein [Gammaproteobacteria bacterium]
MKKPLLSVKNLSVSFNTHNGLVDIIKDISFDINAGENFAIVGESGSGKSVTALSLLRLHEEASTVYSDGKIEFENENLLRLNADQIKDVRGKAISMIFQEPMTSLNPLFTIGKQIEEVLILHQNLTKIERQQRVLELLNRVGIRQPEQKMNDYPHVLSGGQRQRVMIAMALACDPVLLIADEPTTALDVTIQQQILDLLMEIQKDTGMSVLLITHNLNLVRRFAN